MKIHKHAGLIVNRLDAKGAVNYVDMPAVPTNAHSGTKVQYCADLILDHPGPIPFDDLERLGKRADFRALPAPFNLKRQPGVDY
eukprot:12762506-Alexandrium_andersonii.AAC.1